METYNKYSWENWTAKYCKGFSDVELDIIGDDLLESFPAYGIEKEDGNIYLMANAGIKSFRSAAIIIPKVLAEIKKNGTIRIYGEHPRYNEKTANEIMRIYHKYADNK